jgi:hypothetical protein
MEFCLNFQNFPSVFDDLLTQIFGYLSRELKRRRYENAEICARFKASYLVPNFLFHLLSNGSLYYTIQLSPYFFLDGFLNLGLKFVTQNLNLTFLSCDLIIQGFAHLTQLDNNVG